MKNNIVRIFSTLAMIFTLAGCGENTPSAISEIESTSDFVSEDSVSDIDSEITSPVHIHDFKYSPGVPATCTSDGIVEHYHCYGCDTDFDMNRNEITNLVIPATGHDYQLTSDEYYYECQNCHDRYTSGKTEIMDENNHSKKTYLVVGSSIANGYDSTLPNPSAIESHYSFADMLREDYIKASYKFFKDTLQSKEDIYMRRIEDKSTEENKFAGVYRYYEDIITLNADYTGSFNDDVFEYEVVRNHISLKSPKGYLYNFEADFYNGDKVYKYAQDGYTLTDYSPRYVSSGQVNPQASYVRLMQKAINEHADDHIDTFIFQLSTNDAGQYKDSACTQLVDLGEIQPNDKMESKDFNVNTSFGALEWLIAIAKETWNCNVILFTCHMSTGEYATYKANNYDETKVKTQYSDMYDGALQACAKWGISCVNFWADKDVNIAIHEDAATCLADTLHLHQMGYEKVYLQYFRKLLEQLYKEEK